RSSRPGTAIVAGAVTVSPAGAVCGATATAQSPAPPPASARSTERTAAAPTFTSPNDTVDGAAKTSGLSARGRLTNPPPSRVVGASVVRLVSAKAGTPVWTSADLICATVHAGCRWRRRAAAPVTCRLAMLVPLSCAQLSSRFGTDERIWTPGAVTSGLSWSDTGVGPLDENVAITPPFDAAAALIAAGALPGDEIVPRPKSSKSFPAAMAGTTPA